MKAVKRVKKLVSTLSLVSLSVAMLLANVGFAAGSAKFKAKQKVSSKYVARKKLDQVPLSSTQNIRLNSQGLKAFSSKKMTAVNSQAYQAPVLISSNTSYRKKSLLQQNSMTVDQTVEEGKKISGAVSLSHSRSLVDYEDGTSSQSGSAAISISGRLSDNWSISGQTSLEQDMKDSESIGNGMTDTSISVSRKSVQISDSLRAGYSFSTLVPTSKYSSKYQNLEGTFGATFKMGFNEGVLIEGLDINLGIGATRLFHRYDTDVAGTVLNQYSVRESVSTSYNYKKLSFSLDVNHRHAWTYQENVKQAYEISQEIAYSVSPNWGIALGHTNSEAWLKPNGQDSNFKLINDNNSIIYVSTSVMF